MRLKRLFFLTFSFFLILWTITGYSDEISQINAQINQLEGMKRGFESRALRHEDLAERLQFDQQMVLETRRHLQIAEENRQKAALVQDEIDRLNARKAQLQK